MAPPSTKLAPDSLLRAVKAGKTAKHAGSSDDAAALSRLRDVANSFAKADLKLDLELRDRQMGQTALSLAAEKCVPIHRCTARSSL
jgi:hypothetical protein